MVTAMEERAEQKRREHEIAQTILSQLGGTHKLVAMLGAKDFISFPAGYDYDIHGQKLETSDVRGGASFKFANSTPGAPNYCRILLMADDTYSVGFMRLKGHNLTGQKETAGVYADQLRGIFERETGLYLSLGTLGGSQAAL